MFWNIIPHLFKSSFVIGEGITECIQDPTGYPYLIPQTVEKYFWDIQIYNNKRK